MTPRLLLAALGLVALAAPALAEDGPAALALLDEGPLRLALPLAASAGPGADRRL